MAGKTHILISQSQGILRPEGHPIHLVQPPNRVEFAAYGTEVSWLAEIAEVVGTPTAYEIKLKFQTCVETTTGFQYQRPRWVDLDEVSIKSDVVEGVGWHAAGKAAPVGGAAGVIASTGDTLPMVTRRTMRCRDLRHRVAFDLNFTGGTNPGIRLNLFATVRK
ncbi:hypothetical protein [Pseudoclavibacter sp. 8L]|uniref:hypothetical protein n=1 Tax=Pseudoclavibacter sp. 8L TaxID=2653162 RepID=UPI0012F1B0A1|nr:hypothetical protein [Pseudoclavibacter sp. 8L]VXB74719.1 putative Alanine racemase [Pseudoclavibacter sp. 8L]